MKLLRIILRIRRLRKRYKNFLKEGTNLALKDKLNLLANTPHAPVLRILGNGSSINNYEFNIDSGIDYIVVNRFVLSETYDRIKPKYYVIADPDFFFIPEYFKIFEKINDRTDWDMIFFVPDKFKSEKLNRTFTNSKIKLHYFNHYNYYGPEDKRIFCYDHNLAMPNVQNVVVAAISIGLAIRYKTIELFGVEHDWTKFIFVNDRNQTCIYDHHFYDNEKVSWTVFKKNMKMHEVLYMLAPMFESYWELKGLSDRYGVKIINYTEGSFIDAFERKDFSR